MNLYQNPDRPDHAENCAAFLRVVKEFPALSLFQPSPDKAPWHWQAIIDSGNKPQLINFWPHNMQAQRDGFKAVQGEHAVRGIILGAIEDAAEGTLHMIERG